MIAAVVDPRVWQRIAEVTSAPVVNCAPAEALTAPSMRIIGAHAGHGYLLLDWFARLSVASTWRRWSFVSLS